jgi:hypothetical protein
LFFYIKDKGRKILKGEITMTLINVLIIWQIVGGVILVILWANRYHARATNNNILSPFFIYDEWELNWFGTIIICLLFNLLCPVATVIVWFCKFIKFIFTVGRVK